MNYKYLFLSAVLSLFTAFSLLAQKDSKAKFSEALYLMDEKLFSDALPLLKELQTEEKYSSNANLNFNLGLALYKSFDEKQKEESIIYLKKATETVSPKYNPLSTRESSAPVDVYYYLGLAYHNNHQFSKAVNSYKVFKTFINENHRFYDKIEPLIKMSEYAKTAISSPVNVEMHNLGGKLNSFYPDYSPVARIDESALYFTSRRLRKDSSNYQVFDPTDGNMYEDIYVSFNQEGEWQEPHLLNISTSDHEATLNLSIDGQTLYIYKDGEGNGDLFKSELVGDSAGYGIWSQPTKLGADINTDAHETHVTVSPSGRTLYFISDRDGSYGGKDIYYCKKLPTGDWALAQNAGPQLNTKFDEDGVFMHPDGKTLYFSSNGHESMGGYDIVYSTYTDTGWSEVKNMGYPINSVDDDVFFVTTPDEKRAYFSPFKEDGYGEKDIYMLKLIDAEEKALTLYRGEFTYVDSAAPPKGALVTIIDDLSGEIVGSYTPRARDGQFSAILAPNKTYHFIYEADEFRTYEEDIYVPKGSIYQEIFKEIKLRPVRVAGNIDKMVKGDIKLASIGGKLKSRGQIVSNTQVRLLNENSELLATTITGDDGAFNFTALDPTKVYILEIEGDNPPMYGYDLQLTNDQKEEISFENLDNKKYLLTPSLSPYERYSLNAPVLAKNIKSAKEEAIAKKKENLKGIITKKGKNAEGLSIILKQDDSVLGQTKTDETGAFVFKDIDYSKKYQIELAGIDSNDFDLSLMNNANNNLFYIKESPRNYTYYPTSSSSPMAKDQSVVLNGQLNSNQGSVVNKQLNLLDFNKNKVSISKTDSTGNINFKNVDLSSQHYIQLDETFPSDTRIKLQSKEFGEIHLKQISRNLYKIRPLYNAKLVSKNGQILNEVITADEQQITVEKLDKSKFYRLVFKDRSPQDNKLQINDTSGAKITLNYLSRGVYEYNPTKDYDFKPSQVNVDGKLQADGEAISNKKIELLSKDAELLFTVITGKDGSFSFKKLSPIQTYTVNVKGDNPPIQGYDIDLVNDRGEKLIVDKIDSKTYRFKPSLSAEKYIKSTVLLKDKNQNVISKTITDSSGSFQLSGLNIGKEYHLVFEDGFPNETEITITNGKGEKMTFVKTSKNEYKYSPSQETLAQLEKQNEALISGKLKRGQAGLSATKVILKDKSGEELQETVTNEMGHFSFKGIDKSKIHQIELGEEVDGSAGPIHLSLYDKEKNKLLFVKKNNKKFEYYPLDRSSPMAKGSSRKIEGVISSNSGSIKDLQVNLLNVNRNKVFIAKSDSRGHLSFSNIDLSDQHFLQFDEKLPEDANLSLSNSDLGDVKFEKIENGLYKITPIYNAKLVDSNYQIIAESVTKDPSHFYVDEIDRSQTYQLVFKDAAPQQSVITISAQNGEQISLRAQGDGVYQYKMSNNYHFKPESVRVDGKITSENKAVENTKIQLYADSTLLYSMLSGKNGEFSFSKLDPTKTYTIVVNEENPSMQNYKIQLTNNKKEELDINKVDKNAYNFQPSQAAKQYQNASYTLKDNDNNIINQAATSEDGSFQLNKLDPQKSYRLDFSNDFPVGNTIVVKNANDHALQFVKQADGSYLYKPKKPEAEAKPSLSVQRENQHAIKGIVEVNGIGQNGLRINLKDEEGNIIKQASTDQQGEFTFKNLKNDKGYQIEIAAENAQEIDLQLYDHYDNKLLLMKKDAKHYKYYSIEETSPMAEGLESSIEGALSAPNTALGNLEVLLLDEDRKPIQKNSTDSLGKFNFDGIDLSNAHYLRFENLPDNANLKISNDKFGQLSLQKIGTGLYKIQPIYNVKLVNSNNEILKESITNKDNEPIQVENFDKNQTYQLLYKDKSPERQSITLVDKSEKKWF